MFYIRFLCKGWTFCFIVVKVKHTVPLFCVCMCMLPVKAIPEMTNIVSGLTLNPTHSLSYITDQMWNVFFSNILKAYQKMHQYF